MNDSFGKWNFCSDPINICKINILSQIHDEQTFTKGCKWSPDGSCLLTNSSDNILKIFNLPEVLYDKAVWDESIYENIPSEMSPAVHMKKSGTIYDYSWFPQMNSSDAVTCCLVSCSHKCPIHLDDAYDGSERAVYLPYNGVDEIEPAFSVAFSSTGEKLYCGFKGYIRIFDVARPGRECDIRYLRGTNAPGEEQYGIVSTITVNPDTDKLYAVGCYDKSLCLYNTEDGQFICSLNSHSGGLTHIKFSNDGLYLYSGGRKDPQIFCWDIRNLKTALMRFQRDVNTNQRIYFDLTDTCLLSGNTNGLVTKYDTRPIEGNFMEQVLPEISWKMHDDCVNGISLHPFLPIISTAAGQRHIVSSETDEEESDTKDSSVKIWWLGNIYTEETTMTTTDNPDPKSIDNI